MGNLHLFPSLVMPPKSRKHSLSPFLPAQPAIRTGFNEPELSVTSPSGQGPVPWERQKRDRILQ